MSDDRLTHAALLAALDEIKYGPLPTVDDILNDGLEPRMGLARDFLPALEYVAFTIEPMADPVFPGYSPHDPFWRAEFAELFKPPRAALTVITDVIA